MYCLQKVPILRNINVIPTYVCTHGTQSHILQPSEAPSEGVGAEMGRNWLTSNLPHRGYHERGLNRVPGTSYSLFALTCLEWWQTAEELVLRGNNLVTNI